MGVWLASLVQKLLMMKASHGQSVGIRIVCYNSGLQGQKRQWNMERRPLWTFVLFGALVRQDKKKNMRSSMTWTPHLTLLEQLPLLKILSLLLFGTSAFLAFPHLQKISLSPLTICLKLILSFQQQKTYFNSNLWDFFLTYVTIGTTFFLIKPCFFFNCLALCSDEIICLSFQPFAQVTFLSPSSGWKPLQV